MNRIFFFVFIIALGIFISGYPSFSNDKISIFLSTLEDEINRGHPDQACYRLSEDVQYALIDTTTQPNRNISGGKNVLCDKFQQITEYYKNLNGADNHYKTDLEISRSFIFWNTVYVVYDEHHEIEMFPSRAKHTNISRHELTLIKSKDTFIVTNWKISIPPK